MHLTLEETKQFLRVDFSDDDALISTLMIASMKLCQDVARLTDEEMNEFENDLKPAVLYAIAYQYEHREEANHHDLLLTLRALLFGIRKVEF